MDKQNNKSITPTTDHQTTGRKALFIGGVIVFFIVLSPFIFYAYKSFPEVKIWKTEYFAIETSFYSWFDYAWYITNKIVPLYLFLIWFFTCKHWWHWVILVPISMYSFQLWGLVNQNKNLDELELIYILPLMLIIVPAVYVIRAKLFDKVRGDDLKSFEEELALNKSTWQQIKDLFR